MRQVSAVIDGHLLECTIPDTDSQLVEETWTALSRERLEAQRREREWREKRDALNAPPAPPKARVQAGSSFCLAGVILGVVVLGFCWVMATAISGILMGQGGIR